MPTLRSHSPSVVVSVGVQCHVGRERTENQDRVTRSATPFGDLFVVADGVGGYQGGSEAAQATVDGFVSFLKAHGSLPLSEALQQAVRAVSSDLQHRSAANQAQHGMGSTVVLCVVNGSRATYAHVGDSRAYLLRDGHLRQLTRDHSVMERMVSEGLLTPAQAREHPDASVLTRALGQPANVSLDIAEIELQPGDSLLLCSDGLWAYAQHAEMEAIAASEALSASAAAAALLSLALEGGGGDNISIQFLRFTAVERPAKTSSLLGMPRKMAISVMGVAALLAISALGLSIWNHGHPLFPRNPASTHVSIPAPAAASTRPPNPSSPRQTPVAPPQTPSAAGPAPAAPPPQRTVSPLTAPAATPVVIIKATDGAVQGWAGQLRTLDYVQVTERRGNPGCLALLQAGEILYYAAEKAEVAGRVRRDLGLDKSEVRKISRDLRDKCGTVDLVAMPARPSQTINIQDQVKSSAQSAVQAGQKATEDIKKHIPQSLPPQP
jgi:serine/threonine protein phosphatase PrpC